MSAKMSGFKRLDLSKEEMLTDMSKRTGGIPSFAKDALAKAGIDQDTLDRADEAGRK